MVPRRASHAMEISSNSDTPKRAVLMMSKSRRTFSQASFSFWSACNSATTATCSSSPSPLIISDDQWISCVSLDSDRKAVSFVSTIVPFTPPLFPYSLSSPSVTATTINLPWIEEYEIGNKLLLEKFKQVFQFLFSFRILSVQYHPNFKKQKVRLKRFYFIFSTSKNKLEEWKYFA